MLMSRRFWLGATVTLGLLFLFLWRLDFQHTGGELRDADYTYFAPAVLVYFVALAIRSQRWHFLLRHLKAIPARRLFPVVAIGYMSNNVLPVRLGELVRAHFLGEREGISKASALATIGVERVLDGLTLLFLVAVVWPFLPWTDILRSDGGGLNTLWVALSVLVALLFVLGFVVLFLLASFPALGRRAARLASSVGPRSIRPKVEQFGYLLVDGLGALRSPRRLLLLCLLSLPVWLTEAATYYILAISFDLDQPFQVVLLVTATSNLATAIPSSIGGIGPFELVAKSTLIAFGVAAEPAVAYSFFVHIVALWLPVNILGLLFLWKENVSLAQLGRTARIDLSPSRAGETAHTLGWPPGGSGVAGLEEGGTVAREGDSE